MQMEHKHRNVHMVQEVLSVQYMHKAPSHLSSAYCHPPPKSSTGREFEAGLK